MEDKRGLPLHIYPLSNPLLIQRRKEKKWIEDPQLNDYS